MTNAELAKAYGITLAAVSKWTPEKRANAKSEIAAGCCPIIKKLIGELAMECYLTQCVTGIDILDSFLDLSDFTVEQLQSAIKKAKGLRK